MSHTTAPPGVKETGEGPTAIDFVCPCGNEWTAAAHWEVDRIVIDDEAARRCGKCGAEGIS